MSSSELPLTFQSEDPYFITSFKKEEVQRRKFRFLVLITFGTLSVIVFALSVAALAIAVSVQKQVNSMHSAEPTSFENVNNIALGSCTSYDLRPQPIWTEGVIPSAPDMWMWLGDMAYMDRSPLDCQGVPDFAQCNCTSDYMRHPPFQCLAGDVPNARRRMMHQINLEGYQAFLDYMCPGWQDSGHIPPAGTDQIICPRPIVGIYDDHDFGWNNGNRRNPVKAEMKNIFLDGLGEPRDSPRRSAVDGLQTSYVLNKGHGGREVLALLTDGRYFREPLPCGVRAQWCAGVLKSPATGSAGDVAFCEDFLQGGWTGEGSCCTKDEMWAAWCNNATTASDHHRKYVCDPTWAEFGTEGLLLDPSDNVTIVHPNDQLWQDRQGDMGSRMLQGADSPMCEVLGPRQRGWLASQLSENSDVALTVVASGSVVMGSIGYSDFHGPCSGDDWECYKPAQVNLLHTLGNASSGCVVLAVGDYHFADIKLAQPGTNTPYSDILKTGTLNKPVYQLMSSGMTNSTASAGAECVRTFREDLVGLRPLGRCAFVSEPNFGYVSIDWTHRTVSLQIRLASSGQVAFTTDPDNGNSVKQEVIFSLNDCMPL